MDQLQSFLFPFAFFFVVVTCIAYTIKVVVDARTRNKLIATNPSDELVRAWLVHETNVRRRAVLRWGVVLSCLGGGLGLIEVFGWRDLSPGAIGILLGATGIGNLVFYAIDRKSPP